MISPCATNCASFLDSQIDLCFYIRGMNKDASISVMRSRLWIPREKRTYTIDDIARELGVSKTTVSRAISGKGRIGEATRKKVLTFIAEHDYRPNALAKGLALMRTNNIRLVLPGDGGADEFAFPGL